VKKLILITAVLLVTATAVSAQQNYVELRGATPWYNYQEYSRDFAHGLNGDFYHIGVTGQDQFFAGLCRHFTPAKGVTLTPCFYGVVGTNGQRGVMPALIVSVEKGKWKTNAFIGRFQRIKGSVLSYTVLDTADVTHVLNKRFDVGVSTGFFRQEGQWNFQSGPMIRLKDKRGAWAVSYRFGHTNEIRLIRTISF